MVVFLAISEKFRVTEDGLYSPGEKKLELENPEKRKENMIMVFCFKNCSDLLREKNYLKYGLNILKIQG